MIFTTNCGTIDISGGFGAGPKGGLPLGSAYTKSAALFSIRSFEPITTNYGKLIIVGTNNILDLGSQWLQDSILDNNAWSIEPLESNTETRLVQFIEIQSNENNIWTLDIYFDGELSYNKEYKLSTIAFDNCNEVVFTSTSEIIYNKTGIDINEGIVDLANPQILKDGTILGTHVPTSNGDLLLDRGISSLRKRILRRLSTSIGNFYHLPSYGFAPGVKTTLTADVATRIAAKARAQILKEPDVKNCKVQVLSTQVYNVIGLNCLVQTDQYDEISIKLNKDL